MYELYQKFIGSFSDWLYSYILIILLIAAGLYFTFRTNFVQFRMFKESIKLVAEPKEDKDSISPFEALMVSTASRVGVGNIAGVSTAIVLGGAGSVFWMWMIAIIGGASAFIESTLAQIYKVRDKDGGSYGGPAYYIQAALKSRFFGMVFAVVLIFTYMGGFNMVAAFNVASAFESYSFYNSSTPIIVGVALAILTGLSIFKGGKTLSKITSIIVPIMALSYIAVSLIIVVTHLNLVPVMFSSIFPKLSIFKRHSAVLPVLPLCTESNVVCIPMRLVSVLPRMPRRLRVFPIQRSKDLSRCFPCSSIPY